MDAAIIGKLKKNIGGQIKVPAFWKNIIGKENWKSFRNSLDATLGKKYFDDLRYDGYIEFTLGKLYNRFEDLGVLRKDGNAILLKDPGEHGTEKIWKEHESDGFQHDESGLGFLAWLYLESGSDEFKDYLDSIEKDMKIYLESDAFKEVKAKYGNEWKDYSDDWKKYLREKCYNQEMVQKFIDGLKANKFKRLKDKYDNWREYLRREGNKQRLFTDSNLNPDGNVYQARVPTYGYFLNDYDLQVKCVFDGYVKILYDQYKRRGLIDEEMSLHEFCSTYIDYNAFAQKFYGRNKMFWLRFNDPKDFIDDGNQLTLNKWI